MASTKTQWVLRKKREISAKPRLPGVWELRAGGFVVRARIRAPDGRTVEIDRTVQVATALEAANDARRPTVEDIEASQAITTRILELGVKRLLPIEMLALVNEKRPATVEFTNIHCEL